jgi:hypothetical protein
MATKKQNKRDTVRTFRRAFNRATDGFSRMSMKAPHRFYYGGGINRSAIRDRSDVEHSAE